MKTTIRLISTSIGRQFLRSGFILIVLAFVSFGLLPKAQAVVPAPDGGYPGFNTAEGQGALLSLNTSTGLGNTAVGWFSLKSNVGASFNTGMGTGTLLLNTADQNTAVGAAALLLNTAGEFNTAVGVSALLSNTQGSFNTATGVNALSSNTSGAGNSAFGWGALGSNTVGDDNTALGAGALRLSTAFQNTAIGSAALFNNTTGGTNTAVGFRALLNNNAGPQNTAVGSEALPQNTTGQRNNAFGAFALQDNVTGGSNNAFGTAALPDHTNGSHNIAFGDSTLAGLTNGNSNTALGDVAGQALQTGSGNVYIGAVVLGVANEDNHTYIRNINTTSVSGGGTDTVTVDLMTGLLGHLSSSRRHKEQIKSMANSSEVLYRLKPVTYRYKKEIDPSHALDYGLVAEEVAEVDPNLTACNREGQIETVRYNAVNAMLLNEFLKEHKKVEEQQATIAELKNAIVRLAARDEEQAAQIQKVSAQVQLSKASPRTALNHQ
jgi:hypothetical protein